ncbi:MAG TPA: hypothetical protein VHB72_00890 [Candidatus Saccharimonadales bacterium]|nr:hypothetical protein [Candidatus Saccharimonadales bacterium]
MADFYFERYRDHAAKALQKQPVAEVTNGTLIEGIEDIGGVERAAISRAVPVEAKLVMGALRSANNYGGTVIKHAREKDGEGLFLSGWALGELPDGASYFTGGRARREMGAVAFLDGSDGNLYAYSQQVPSRSVASGTVLDRYEPVNATSMNDRAVLFGLAMLAVHFKLDVQAAPAEASV